MSRTKDKIKLEYYEMPTVGGSPVVESGSNSDGEWTRWADGTQMCKTTPITGVDVTSTEGNIFASTTATSPDATLPVAFVGDYRGFVNEDVSPNMWGGLRRSSDSVADWRLMFYDSITNRAAVLTVFGRWK